LSLCLGDKVGILIRKATLKDASLLFLLALELMAHNRNLNKKDKVRYELLELVPNIRILWKKWVTKNITSPNGYVLVASFNGKTVGYSLNFIKENTKVYLVKKTGYVGDLYIKRGYRNKGIATKFKELAFKWFRKKGMKYVSIAVHSKNVKAHLIYKKWGFFDYHIEMRKKL